MLQCVAVFCRGENVQRAMTHSCVYDVTSAAFHEQVKSHELVPRTSHVSHLNELCHTYECAEGYDSFTCT